MASTSFSLPNQFVGRPFSPFYPPHSTSFRPSTGVSAAYATIEKASSSGAAFQTAYEVLGIQTGATCQEIKSAYRKLVRVLHPDVAPSADEFMRVHAAYATLADPEKRAVYDSSILRRSRRTAYGLSEMSRRRRTWETDQCW